MQIHEFNHLRNILQSLNDSADLTIGTTRVGATWTRRNSPYKSHQGIDFTHCSLRKNSDDYTLHSQALIAANSKYEFAINITPQSFPINVSGPAGISIAKFTDESHDFHEVGIPEHLIPTRLKVCIEIALGTEIHGIIFFTFLMRKVASWDSDGKPIFAEIPAPEHELITLMKANESRIIRPYMVREIMLQAGLAPACKDGICRFLHDNDLLPHAGHDSDEDEVSVSDLLKHESLGGWLHQEYFVDLVKYALTHSGSELELTHDEVVSAFTESA
jgi:hypothetical protein